MNVLKPLLQATVKTLEVATGANVEFGENPPPRPPAQQSKPPKHAHSACEQHREWIEEQQI